MNLFDNITMKFIVKQPKQCTRQELDMFYTLVLKLWLSSPYFIRRICRSHLLGLCIDNEHIVWISAIKRPQRTRKDKITTLTKIWLSKNMWEYGYVYVQSKYRWLWITKKLYTLLIKKTHIPLFATVKKNNIPMKKLLEGFGFFKQWSFKNFINKHSIELYLHQE